MLEYFFDIISHSEKTHIAPYFQGPNNFLREIPDSLISSIQVIALQSLTAVFLVTAKPINLKTLGALHISWSKISQSKLKK